MAHLICIHPLGAPSIFRPTKLNSSKVTKPRVTNKTAMAARILHPTYPPFVLLCIRPLFISPILCPPLNLPHTPNSHREFSTTCIKFWFLLTKSQ